MIKTDLARRAEELAAQREPYVQATVVRALHPTSVRPGDTALVLRDGEIDGFVGGMCAQTSVRLYGVRAIETGEPVLLRLEPGAAPPNADDEPQDGVVVAHNPCLSGGTLEIFLEPQLPPARIVVVGGTPIARALSDIAWAAGYDVVSGEADEVDPQPGDAGVVVASHGDEEELALTKALDAGVGYVGLVASAKRGTAVRDSLDVSEEARTRIRTPVGLEIGARAPSEVAISILAEIVAERAAGRIPRGEAAPSDADATPGVAIDPICGMEVIASDASVHVDTPEGPVYFCREGCRDTFLEQQAARV